MFKAYNVLIYLAVFLSKFLFMQVAQAFCHSRFVEKGVELSAGENNKSRHIYPGCKDYHACERAVYDVIAGEVVYIKRKPPGRNAPRRSRKDRTAYYRT